MEIKLKETVKLTDPEKVTDLLYKVLKNESPFDQDKEHFWTIGLNARNVVKYVELVSLGTLTANLVHPREVFRQAISKGIAVLLVIHNHPSNSLEPSDEDRKLTKMLVEAGKIMGIEVMDHVIIGKDKSDGYLSFKEKSFM